MKEYTESYGYIFIPKNIEDIEKMEDVLDKFEGNSFVFDYVMPEPEKVTGVVICDEIEYISEWNLGCVIFNQHHCPPEILKLAKQILVLFESNKIEIKSHGYGKYVNCDEYGEFYIDTGNYCSKQHDPTSCLRLSI